MKKIKKFLFNERSIDKDELCREYGFSKGKFFHIKTSEVGLDDCLNSYTANLHDATRTVFNSILLQKQPSFFCSWFMPSIESRAESQEYSPCCLGHCSEQRRHLALCLIKLYSNQRTQSAGFEDAVNFALTAGGRVKKWQPAIRDRQEENKK